MRASLTCLLLSAVSLQLSAQQVCFARNEGLAPFPSVTPAATYAVLIDPTQVMTVTAVEWKGNVVTAGAVRSTAVAVWLQDPSSGAPLTALATGTMTFQGDVAFYSAVLSVPVTMTPGTGYFVSFDKSATADQFAPVFRSASTPGAVASQWYYDTTHTGASWSGPYSNAFAFRLHCGIHTGNFANYGTGVAGTDGRVATMAGLGFPNVGNSFALQLWNVRASSPAAVLIGLRSNTPTPIVPLYLLPVLFDVSGTTGAKGSFSVSAYVPNDPMMVGLQLAFQGVAADVNSPLALPVVTSDVVEVTVGG